MATQQRTVDYLLEQATGAGAVSTKPMFGEYEVYIDGKMIGSICDDQLYVKPTASGRFHAEPVSEASPHPGAKPHLLIKADRWDDAEWLGELLRVTAAELPIPKPAETEAKHISACSAWVAAFSADHHEVEQVLRANR